MKTTFPSKLLKLSVLCFALCSCGPLLPRNKGSVLYYVIDEIPGTQIDPPDTPESIDLLVRETQASRFLNSNKIVFSEDPSNRGFYQFAHWVEPPTRRLSTLLLARLEQSKAFQSVARLGSASLGNYQLDTELIEFYHNTQKRPGKAVVIISAELIDLKQRRVVARHQFQKFQSVKAYNVRGAVKALSLAANEIIEEIVLWSVDSILSAEHAMKAASKTQVTPINKPSGETEDGTR